MPSRVERYEQTKVHAKRVEKNQQLYQELKNYNNYDDISEIEPVIQKENFNLKEITETRKKAPIENRDLLPTETISSLFQMDAERVHDINKILNEAKKQRTDKDSLEEKRKLKKAEYNITSKIDVNNLEEIEKERKKSGVLEEEQEELKELIDTIYSKKLREEIDEKIKDELEEQTEEGDLLEELLPTSSDETLVNGILSQEMKEKEKQNTFQNSFFTKSMEISGDDLEDDDDDDFELDDRKIPGWLLIIILISVLGIIAFAGYFVYHSML